jgi:hypothetical protein
LASCTCSMKESKVEGHLLSSTEASE